MTEINSVYYDNVVRYNHRKRDDTTQSLSLSAKKINDMQAHGGEECARSTALTTRRTTQ